MTQTPWDHIPRRTFTPAQRAKLFLARGGRCHRCKRKLYPPRDKYIIEHLHALACGGSNGEENLEITCTWCKPEKDAEDHKASAKMKRTATKQFVPKSERKKRSRFKGWRKFNGDLVWNDNQ